MARRDAIGNAAPSAGSGGQAGADYAIGAGVFVGSHEHTHFHFQVIEQGGAYPRDPWLLFWAILRQERARNGQKDRPLP